MSYYIQMPATCKSCSFLNLSTHNQTFKGNFWFSFLCVFLVLLKSTKTLRSNMITGCHPCGDCLVMPRLSLSVFSSPFFSESTRADSQFTAASTSSNRPPSRILLQLGEGPPFLAWRAPCTRLLSFWKF